MWYTVQAGDSLSLIAQRYLGSLMLYNEIFNQNRDVLVSPDIVQIGQRLWIPVDGKAKPDLLAQTPEPSTPPPSSPTPAPSAYDMGPPSPYESTFPDAGSQTVLPAPKTAAPDQKQKYLLYAAGGMAVLGLAALLM